MHSIYSAIALGHNFPLLVVAGIIGLLSTFTAFSVVQQAGQKPLHRWPFLATAATVTGLGMWAMQFTAILAYAPARAVSYDLIETLLSAVISVAVAGTGWALALAKRPILVPIGGAVIGFGAAGMHYLGISAIQMDAGVVWEWQLFVATAVVGVGFAAAAVWYDCHKPHDPAWVAAPILTLALCIMHLATLSAVSIQTHPVSGIAAQGIDRQALAIVVMSVTLLIMAIGAGNALADRRSSATQLLAAQEHAAAADAILRGAAERELLTAQLRHQADISAAALDNMAQGLSMYDGENRLVIHNSRYSELYGIPHGLLKTGSTFLENYADLVKFGALAPISEAAKMPAKFDPSIRNDHEIPLPNGHIILLRRRPLPGGGWVATHDDVTEARKASEQIAYLAAHDPLTGLPNRAAFTHHLDGLYESGRRFAVHTIDLDRFKEVNDTLGHPVGDEILRGTATRLRGLVGNHDFVTRLGGDEFAIVQAEVDEAAASSALAGKIVERLSEPFEFDGHTITIGASVGISLAPQDAGSGDELLKMSDLALYCAKDESRGTYRFFEPGMDLRLVERRQLEADLKTAIQKGQFEVFYQPLLDMDSGTISCFEALVRWHHPVRGLVQPADFIATAEDSGLIIPIGEWVLRQACRDAASWPSNVGIAVNLSSAQFKRGDIVAMVVSSLAAAGLDPKRLELEITESVLLHDEAWVQSTLDRLTALGVGIAMDDFGTGYSSLSYLRSFPFTKIKIDRSFISDLAGKTDAFAIVQATIQLSQKLGMQIVAEGVETAEQMQILASEGCNQAQGYLVSRPVPIGEVGKLLRTYNLDQRDGTRAVG